MDYLSTPELNDTVPLYGGKKMDVLRSRINERVIVGVIGEKGVYPDRKYFKCAACAKIVPLKWDDLYFCRMDVEGADGRFFRVDGMYYECGDVRYAGLHPVIEGCGYVNSYALNSQFFIYSY
jgi:hypothetical protein